MVFDGQIRSCKTRSYGQTTSNYTKTYSLINCCSRLVTHSGISDRFFIAQFAKSPWTHCLPNVQMHLLPPTTGWSSWPEHKLIAMARANAARNQQRFPMVIADRPFCIHLSVCWRKRHTHTRARARVRTHQHTQTRTHTHTHTHSNVRDSALGWFLIQLNIKGDGEGPGVFFCRLRADVDAVFLGCYLNHKSIEMRKKDFFERN